jgi:uncharacterized protein (TIGR04141 family)
MSTSVIGDRKLRLTVFLIKPEYTSARDFIRAPGFEWVPIEDEDYPGMLICRGNFRSVPSWVSIFEDVDGFPVEEMKTVGAKAVYTTRVDNRWFCFTFGHARHLIHEDAVERNFGLIVALNLGDPEAIKAIDKTSMSHIALQSREQAARDIAIESFEFDTEIDLLKSVTAKTKRVDGAEQETYSGRDSVSVYTEVSLDTLPLIAQRLARAYRSKRYKQRYPWIDKVTEERDREIVGQLNDALVSHIRGAQLTKIWMAVPEVLDWEEVEGFTFTPGSRDSRRAGPVVYGDLDLEEWLRVVDLSETLTLKHLTQRRVFQLFKDARSPASWTIYRCLNAEIDLAAKKYILNDGEWYCIDPNYVSEVNGFYAGLASSSLSLPRFGTSTEPEYLKGFEPEKLGFAYMDRKEIMIGGGRSRVEFCDLFSRDGHIVHVKRYGGSAVLSHLFNQAVVSADCFINEPTFRTELNALLPGNYKLADVASVPNAPSYTVCLAIMSKEPGDLELPFFSKVSLKYAVRALRRMGFKVAKLKIDR